MKTIDQDLFESICIEADENMLTLDDGFDSISTDKKGAAKLIEILQEWIDSNGEKSKFGVGDTVKVKGDDVHFRDEYTISCFGKMYDINKGTIEYAWLNNGEKFELKLLELIKKTEYPVMDELGGYKEALKVIKHLGGTPTYKKYIVINSGKFGGFINSRGYSVRNPHVEELIIEIQKYEETNGVSK